MSNKKIAAASTATASDIYEITSSTVAGGKRGLDVIVGGTVLSDGSGVSWDLITITYPTTTSEVFTYSLSAVTVRTITIVYTDSSKNNISTVARA